MRSKILEQPTEPFCQRPCCCNARPSRAWRVWPWKGGLDDALFRLGCCKCGEQAGTERRVSCWPLNGGRRYCRIRATIRERVRGLVWVDTYRTLGKLRTEKDVDEFVVSDSSTTFRPTPRQTLHRLMERFCEHPPNRSAPRSLTKSSGPWRFQASYSLKHRRRGIVLTFLS